MGPLGEYLFFKIIGSEESNILGWSYLYTELWTFILFTSFGYLLGRSTERIEHMAFHDSLTGIFNRGVLMEQFKELLAVHHRYKQDLSVIMFDLDFFKKINDQYGHPVGDKTLIAVTDTVKATCRSSDVFGRFGGEEFLILCPNTTREEGLNLAERIRQQISSIPSDRLGHPGPQTVSLGIITVPQTHRISLHKILKALDDALYEAKSAGRNQVRLSTSLQS